ncbi:MAG: triose-phosphate isomerase [Gemmatimonadales bacterium]|nr:MAG: triose-phosphate isomerase [Gemmatimonadales bacterium]
MCRQAAEPLSSIWRTEPCLDLRLWMTMKHDKRPLFAANWKMNNGPQSTREFLVEFTRSYEHAADRRVIFFPPSISLEAFSLAASHRPDLELGVQDVHAESAGAHTGAISATMALEAGASWSLVGHSERRNEFGDDDDMVVRKTLRALASKLAPMVCVGETLEERDAGRLSEILGRQVAAILSVVEPGSHSLLTWAYEPIWAIGTGRTASPEDALDAHNMIRAAIAATADDQTARNTVIVYGGSVNPSNIDTLMDVPGVDGVLVGGASLQPADFAAICNSSAIGLR